MEEIAPRLRAGETIAVVSHFWTSRVLVGSLLKLPIETMLSQLDYKPATGSVLVVDCRIDERGAILIRRKDLLSTPQGIPDEA